MAALLVLLFILGISSHNRKIGLTKVSPIVECYHKSITITVISLSLLS